MQQLTNIKSIVKIAAGLFVLIGIVYLYLDNKGMKAKIDANQSTIVALINGPAKTVQQIYQKNLELFPRLDSIRAALKIRPKTVTNVIENTITNNYDTTLTLNHYDSIHGSKEFQLKDICSNILGTIYWSSDSIRYISSRTEVVDVLNYWERPVKFLGMHFGKKNYFSTIDGNCPNTKYVINKSIVLKKKY